MPFWSFFYISCTSSLPAFFINLVVFILTLSQIWPLFSRDWSLLVRLVNLPSTITTSNWNKRFWTMYKQGLICFEWSPIACSRRSVECLIMKFTCFSLAILYLHYTWFKGKCLDILPSVNSHIFNCLIKKKLFGLIFWKPKLVYQLQKCPKYSTGKFGSFKNPYATITCLPEIYFRFRRLTLLEQTKKVISMNYGSMAAAQAAENHGDEDGLIFMRDIYINPKLNQLTKFTSSSKNTVFIDILQWNISKVITKTIPISTRIVITNAIKQGIPFWDMIRIFQSRESHSVHPTFSDGGRRLNHLPNFQKGGLTESQPCGLLGKRELPFSGNRGCSFYVKIDKKFIYWQNVF